MKSQDIRIVGVVGAGTMGAAIAQHFLMKGLEVWLVDQNEKGISRGRELIERSLKEAEDRKVIRAEDREKMTSSLRTSLALSDLKVCQLIVEAVFEDLGVKKTLFGELEKVVPKETLLATNTSSFSLSDLGSDLKHPERFLGVHYFYHAAKNKLVEVIGGERTPKSVVTTVRDFYSFYGKLPIVVQDAPGFAVNRFFVPWLNEAVRLYEEGVGSMKRIDEVACETFKIGMGPFALMNATGVPIAYHAAEGLAENLGPFYRAAGRLKEQASKGPWEIESGDAKRDPLCDEAISHRLLGAALGVAVEMVSEGVTTPTDADLGARIGLRWVKGPFEMMSEIGVKNVEKLVEPLFRRFDRPLPKLFQRPDEIQLEWVYSYWDDSGSAFIVVNRPDSMNALNESVMKQLALHFEKVSKESRVKKIIFAGVGKAFIAGADIKFFVDHIEGKSFERIYDFTHFGQEFLKKIAKSQKPTVAYIDGLALGGGLELALACQYRWVTSRAVMAFPETGIGIYPGLGGTQRASRLIGKGLAKFMIATGKMVPATQAVQYGLADALVDRVGALSELGSMKLEHGSKRGSFEEEAFASFSGALAGEMNSPLFMKFEKQLRSKAPIALQRSMELVDRGESLPLDEALNLELAGLKEIFATQDAYVGLKSLIDRTRPVYTGA